MIVFPLHPGLERILPVRVGGEMIGPAEARFRAFISGMMTVSGLACCDVQAVPHVEEDDPGATLEITFLFGPVSAGPGNAEGWLQGPSYKQTRAAHALDVCESALWAVGAGRHPLQVERYEEIEIDSAGWSINRDESGAVVADVLGMN